MGHRLGLGSAVGGVVSLMFWRGNQTPHLVSTFPDAMTFFLLLGLLSVAIGFDQRRHPREDRVAQLRAGLTVAAAAGVVFGSAVALLGIRQFTSPAFVLLAFGFLTALSSALACGTVATLAWSRWRHVRAA